MLVIPVINIEPLFGNDIEAKMNVARQIDEVCRVSGFFQIKNHGISTQSLEALTSKTFDFFKKLTTEQKMSMASKKFNSSNSHLYRGYFPASVNGKDTSSIEIFYTIVYTLFPLSLNKGKEGFDIGNPTLNETSDLLKLPCNEVTLWPPKEVLPDFKDVFTDFYLQFFNLAQTLLRGFALATGQEEDFFQRYLKIDDTMSTFRLNHYPFLDNIDAIEIAKDGTKIGK